MDFEKRKRKRKASRGS